MAAPIGSVQGLASNIQWQDLVDQIVAQDLARTLAPVTTRISTDKTRVSAWSSYKTLVAKLQDAAATLKNSAFDLMKASASTDTSGRALVSASAGAEAVPGTYRAEVLALATADKVGGAGVASATAALGLS